MTCLEKFIIKDNAGVLQNSQGADEARDILKVNLDLKAYHNQCYSESKTDWVYICKEPCRQFDVHAFNV